MQTTKATRKIKGDITGKIATKTVPIDLFNKVNLACIADVNFTVSDTPSADVSYHESLVDSFVFRVENGVLTIDLDSDATLEYKPRAVVNISAPSLNVFVLSGVGDVNISGIDNEGFRAQISGQGDIYVAGKTGMAILEIYGSGDLMADKLIAKDVIADIRGSGDILGFASGDLTANISGKGDVIVKGTPKFGDTNCSGSGSIKVG